MAEYSKQIIVLANSRKISGRCIAGKERGDRSWVRPVSDRPNAELSEDDRRFKDGTDPKVLDVVTVWMIRPDPKHHQIENHLINNGYYWVRDGALTYQEALSYVDPLSPLWGNSSSSYNGVHDRVAEGDATHDDGSLRLIKVGSLKVHVSVEGAEFGNAKRRVRGEFEHHGSLHLLSITDPVVEREFLLGADGVFDLGEALLCISLSEPYQGHLYKLIAAVIRKP